MEFRRGLVYYERSDPETALRRVNSRSLMDRTRSTLLMRVRDPADAEAWGEFVALDEPLLRA